MSSNHRTLFILLVSLGWLWFFQYDRALSNSTAGSTGPGNVFQLSWKRIEPEKWFSINIPRKWYQVTDAVDANATTYLSEDLNIHYIYWLNGNTPHFIQWERDHKNQIKPDSSIKTIFKRKIRAGRSQAILSKYRMHLEGKVEYILEIYFPRTKVTESGMTGLGEFKLSVTYSDARKETIAQSIIESLRFH
jgi:hypothetical protein